MDTPILDTRNHIEGMGAVITEVVLALTSHFAQQERENIRKRQRAGIDYALEHGTKGNKKNYGRPKVEAPANFDDVVKRWRNKKITAVQAFTQLDITKATFYRMVKVQGK